MAAIWLGALALLWAGLLFGGFAMGTPDVTRGTEHDRRMPTWTRMASSLTLVAAAWTWLFLAYATMAALPLLGIALGMTLGCLGDFALAGLLRLPQPMLAGIAAFGLGHVAYCAALVAIAARAVRLATAGFWCAWGAWILIGGLGWYLVVARGRPPALLRRAALPYALLLASTAGAATGLALGTPAFASVALGAALFLASDLVLAAQLFGGLKFPLIGDVIWLTYGPAQLLIVYGTALALLPTALR